MHTRLRAGLSAVSGLEGAGTWRRFAQLAGVALFGLVAGLGLGAVWRPAAPMPMSQAPERVAHRASPALVAQPVAPEACPPTVQHPEPASVLQPVSTPRDPWQFAEALALAVRLEALFAEASHQSVLHQYGFWIDLLALPPSSQTALESWLVSRERLRNLPLAGIGYSPAEAAEAEAQQASLLAELDEVIAKGLGEPLFNRYRHYLDSDYDRYQLEGQNAALAEPLRLSPEQFRQFLGQQIPLKRELENDWQAERQLWQSEAAPSLAEQKAQLARLISRYEERLWLGVSSYLTPAQQLAWKPVLHREATAWKLALWRASQASGR